MIDRQGCQEKNILCHKTGLPNYAREKGCQGTNILHHHKTGYQIMLKRRVAKELVFFTTRHGYQLMLERQCCQGNNILYHKIGLPTKGCHRTKTMGN